MVKLDINTILLGGLIVGGLGLAYYYSKPAKERAKTGDTVLVGYNFQGLQILTRMLITKTDNGNVTGNLIDQPTKPQVTTPRNDILRFA